MAKNVGNIAHKKSAQVLKDAGGSILGPKLPDASMLVEGEIAVNYADGYETLSIKNSSGEISTFSSDAIISDTIDSKISGKADTTAVTAVNNELKAHKGDASVHVTTADKTKWDAVTGKANASDLTTHTANTTVHITDAERKKWNAKAEVSAVTTVNNTLTAHTTNNGIHVTAEKKATWDAKAEVSDVTAVSDDLAAHTADTTVHITDAERTKWNTVTGKANTNDVYSKTAADAKFQALGNYVSATTLNNYSTTAQVEEKITAAVSGKANSSTVTSINKVLTAHTASTDVHVTTGDKATWNAVTGKADSSTVSAINSTLTGHTGDTTIHVTSDDKTKWNAVTGKADTSAVTTVSNNLSAHTTNTTVHVTQANKDTWNKVTSKADATALTSHTNNANIHVTTGDKNTWNAVVNKANASDLTDVHNALTAHTSNDNMHVTTGDKATWDAKAEVSAVTTVSNALTTHKGDNIVHITAAERTKWDAVTGKADKSAVTTVNNALTAHTSDNDIHVTTGDKATWNAVSGKANSSTVTSINNTLTAHTASTSVHVTTGDKATWNAVTGKADSSTVTSINKTLTAHTGNGNIHVTTGDKATWNTVTAKTNTSDFTTHTGNTTVHITDAERKKWNGKAEVSKIPTKVSQLTNDSSFIRSAQYDSAAKAIKFYDIASSAITTATTAVATVDATAFIKDGMVSSASVSNGKLVITFNADAGKENISIPITDIFNASNYYTTANTYSKTEVNNLLADKSNTGHTHAIADVTNLQSTLNGKANATHTHAISGVTGLQAALDGKSSTSHTHAISGVTGLQAALDGKSNTNHTHKYAGSSTAGGSATSAVKLDTATAGSATQPVYFTEGKPAACTYTLGKSVPSNAVFTDTHYASTTVTSNAADGKSTVAATGNGTVYLNHVENNSVKSSHNIKGAGATTVTSDSAGTITISSTNTTYGTATQSANGLMSSSDKSKLDGIAPGADAVSFAQSLTTGTKVGTITINGTGTDLYCQTNTDTHHTGKTIVASATTATSNGAATQGNVYMNHIENGAVRSSNKIVGAGATSVASDSAGTITISSTNTTYGNATTGASGLMSASDKSKLDGIAAGANKYTHPSATAHANGLYKVTVNDLGHVTAANAVAKADITALGIPGQDTHYTSNTIVASANTATANGAASNGNVFLNHIENGAVRNYHNIKGGGATTVTSDSAGTITISSTNTTYGAATTSANGLMSASDKSKLDGITASADAVSFSRSLTSGTKVGTITINGTGTDLYCQTNTDTHHTGKTIVASATTATANGAATNGNVYMNHIENGAVRSYNKIVGAGATKVTSDSAGTITITSTDNNTTYSAGSGIAFNGTQINNSGVRSISSGSDNGTISVNTNGSTANVAVKGLGSAAYTNSGAYAAASHTHSYLPLAGGTITGSLILKGGTSADMTYSGNTHPFIRFDNTDSSQNVSLIFTDYDNYRSPAGVKLVGNQGNEWFEAANIYATTFHGALSGNASSASKLATARTITINGSVTGSATFDGSGNITIGTTTNHTHNYAGSNSAGGAANSAVALTTATAGSATQPVYFTGGKPAACTYTLGKSVPADAVFTDTNTHYASNTIVASAATATSNGAAANGNVYLNHIENGGVRNAHKIVGGGATTVTSDTAGTITISSTNTTYGTATTSANGLMSAGDKSKLDGIQAGADAVSFTRSLTGGTKIGTLTINGTGTDLYCQTNTNTTYSAGAGIGLNGTQFYNSGVRAIGTGTANGTISVNTNGTAADVAVKGLGSAAYTNSNAYAAASHTHKYAGSSSAGGAANSSNVLNSNARMDYGWNGINYFNAELAAGCKAKTNDAPTKAWWHIMRFNHGNNAGYYTDLAIPFNADSLYWKTVRGGNLPHASWVQVLDAINYTSYAPTKTGGGASGTWGISINGNAATASKLATARTITLAGSVTGSVSFDGSGNVTANTTTNHTHNYAGSSSAGGAATSANKVANALTLQFNGTTNQTYDGSAAKTFNVTPSAIGAAASSHSHDDRYYTESETNNLLNAKLSLAGGTMTGNINYTAHGNSYIGNGPNDAANGLGGDLNNLVISSWYGVSFTTSCTGQAYTNKNAVSINCRNGHVYANTFVGNFSGNATSANKVANALTLQFNGTTNQTYNGSAAKTFNVTPAAIGALPTAAQQFKAVDVTTNQANVTCPFTFNADGQNGTVMYRNTGSANVTISISTNYLTPVKNEQIVFTIVPGGYGEVNYLRYNSSVIVARGL